MQKKPTAQIYINEQFMPVWEALKIHAHAVNRPIAHELQAAIRLYLAAQNKKDKK